MLRWNAQLLAYGPWGNNTLAPRCVDATAFRAFVAAKQKAQGLALLGTGDGVGTDKSLRNAPLALSSRLVAPAALNQKSAIKVLQGSADEVEQLYNTFGRNIPALGFISHDGSPFECSAQVTNDVDQGWAAQFWVTEPPRAKGYPAFTFRWGNVALNQGWQFRLVKGRASIVRLKPAWNQGAEDALNDLLALDTLSEAAETEVQAAKDRLYGEEVSLEGANLYSQALSLQIIPDFYAFYVVFAGKRVRVEASALDAQGEPLPTAKFPTASPFLWDNSPLHLRSNGGSFYWQLGYSEFARSGLMRLGNLLGFYDPDTLPEADVVQAVNAYLPPGTSATLQRVRALNGNGEELYNIEFALVLTTTNRRVSPIVTGLSLFLKGGERDGNTDLYWDSSALWQGTEAPPVNGPKSDVPVVLDVVLSCEGWNGLSRKRQAVVYLADINGAASYLMGFRHELLEHRVATVRVNGEPVITEGLILSAKWASVQSWTPELIRQRIASGETTIELTVVDGNAILEERRCKGEWADTKWSGAYLRELLGNVGFKAWQLAGIPLRSGRLHRAPLPGEPFRIRADKGQTYAAWIAQYLKTYLPGWTLYLDEHGVWQFQPRDTSTKAILSSEPARYSESTYPGRYVIFEGLNLVRDASEFYNVLSASYGSASYSALDGDEDEDGETYTYVLHESIQAPSNAHPKNWIGRIREGDTISGAGIEDKASANLALRATVIDQGLPRFGDINSFFHTKLWPGDHVIADGQPCRILRIPRSSLAEDEMDYGLQETA